MPEQKSRPLSIKAIDDRTVTTLFSVAGNVDHYSDRMINGAFQKTFQERGTKILHLWSHQTESPPIAVIKSLREVSRNELPAAVQAAYPDATGGAEAVSEYLDHPLANSVLAGIKAGAPLEASFMYDVLQSGFTSEDAGEQKIRVRNIKEVRLFEVSTVNLGANSATVASKAKPPTHHALKSVLRELKMDGMDMAPIWEAMADCQDISSAAYAMAAVASLLSGEIRESDDPGASAMLITALRMLLAFAQSELDAITIDITQLRPELVEGPTLIAPPEMASLRGVERLVKIYASQVKAGARNATSDQGMIDAIHAMSVDLGAKNCKGILSAESGDKSRADDHAPSLTQLRQRLAYLDFTTP